MWCFWAISNVKSLLNMLCALDLRRIFVPKAKSILLVKQSLFHLLTDLSYPLLKTTVTQTYLSELWLISRNIFFLNNQGIFAVILSQKVWFNDDESASSWANMKRQVYPPSLVTVHLCLWMDYGAQSSCAVWFELKRFCCFLPLMHHCYC